MHAKPGTLIQYQAIDQALEHWITLSKNETAAIETLRNYLNPQFAPTLPSHALLPSQVPQAGDAAFRIAGFAATFEGYAYVLETAVLLAAANALKRRYFQQGHLPDDLSVDELRALLYAASRASKHAAELEEENRRLEYVHFLLQEIKQALIKTQSAKG